jgi:hypothetical protein
MEKNMKELSLKESNMVKEYIHGLMDVYMKGNIIMELEKVKENIFGPMEEFLKECL